MNRLTGFISLSKNGRELVQANFPLKESKKSSFKEILWKVQRIEFLCQACNACGEKQNSSDIVRRVQPPITEPCTEKEIQMKAHEHVEST